MRIAGVTVVMALGLSFGALWAQQQMPGMAGMDMGQKKAPPKAVRGSQQAKPADAMPADMQGMSMDADDKRAQQSAASEANSARQQAGQAEVKPGDGSDRKSLQVPVEEMQEPEALELRTGGDVPAPELLGDVVRREPMMLEQFLTMADGANPTLKQAELNVERSKQQARQAGLPPDPTVGYSGDHIRGGQYHGGEQGAFFSQEFVLGRKLALRRDIYRAEGRANEMALEVQRARVHNDVARAFFDALAAQQSVVLRDRLLKLAMDRETNTHELARVGQEDAAAILTAEVEVEQARIEFVAAQRVFLGEYARLAAMAGQHAVEVHPLRGSLVGPPGFDPEEYVRRDVEESPLVKRAQAEEAVNEARVKDAKRERLPNLNITAGEWYSGEALGFTGVAQKAGWESFAQAGVQLPLWNRNQGNIGAAQVLLERAHRDVERTKLWTRSETEPLAQEYLTAKFTAERYRTEMLPRARRAYELQVMKYQEMSLEYPAVLKAQEVLFRLQLGYTEALNAQWRAAIALQNYALTDGLGEPLQTGGDETMSNLPSGVGK